MGMVMNALAHILSVILVPLFFAGIIGSLLVVFITIAKDLGQIGEDHAE